MTEEMLHFAWKSRRYAAAALQVQGKPLVVLDPGLPNPNQGPDFLFARLKWGEHQWHGHVEVHVRSQEWFAHHHHTDPNYNPVVLHVVAQAGKRLPLRQDGTPIPELVLGPHLDANLLRWHAHLKAQGKQQRFACAGLQQRVPAIKRNPWVNIMGWERMLAKQEELGRQLAQCHYDWEQLVYAHVLRSLAGNINQEAFSQMAAKLPYSLLLRYRTQLPQLEALLLGVAGLLPEQSLAPTQPTEAEWHSHWHHLKRKHGLQSLPEGQMKYLRMRPANFPDLRLAQMAQLVHRLEPLMTFVAQPRLWRHQAAQLPTTPYWQQHYRLGKPGPPRAKPLGQAVLQRLLINCLIPASVLYYKALKHDELAREAFDLLEELDPEDHHVAQTYAQAGFQVRSALDTQGLLHLQRHYCSPLRCFSCGIGQHLLHTPGPPLDPPDA